jgi:hypothetical protein
MSLMSISSSTSPPSQGKQKWMWEDGLRALRNTGGEVAREGLQEIGAPLRRRLDSREILDALKSRYYQIEASVAESSAQADKVMRQWL